MATNATMALRRSSRRSWARSGSAQRPARAAFRLKFVLTWAVILGVVGVAIVATGQRRPGVHQRVDRRTSCGGAGLTILISVVSITLAAILAVIGALGRLSRNGFINGVASLYVSLVRGTPLLVQI